MADSKVEIRVTEWQACLNGPWYPSLPHGGFVAYRIWQKTDGLGWFQRHEWKRADNVTEKDEWINGVRGWCSSSAAFDEKEAA